MRLLKIFHRETPCTLHFENVDGIIEIRNGANERGLLLRTVSYQHWLMLDQKGREDLITETLNKLFL